MSTEAGRAELVRQLAAQGWADTAIAAVTHMSVELVTPATWKRSLGLSTDKRASLHKARLLFQPADLALAKHEGRAEALLIAHWALRRAPRAAA